MIKLVAIDMDGTLLDSQKALPEENIHALNRIANQGIRIVLCTGRAKSGVIPYFEKLGLEGQEEYAIMDNGCTIYRARNWSLLAYRSLTGEEIEDLANHAQGYDGIDLAFFDRSHYFILGKRVSELAAYDASLVFNTVTLTDLASLKNSPVPIFQGMFMGTSDQLDYFQATKGDLLSQSFSVVRSQPCLYEVLPKGATKASALEQLTAHLGLSSDQIMAIGDAANDIEMLQFAGLSVAMGNASDEIKSLADYVTADHNQAGVAQAIDRFIP